MRKTAKTRTEPRDGKVLRALLKKQEDYVVSIPDGQKYALLASLEEFIHYRRQ